MTDRGWRRLVSFKSIAKGLASIAIDAIGVISIMLPVVGETADMAWAPISAYLVQAMYGNGWLTSLAFFEEVLPYTDVVPTATLGWVLEHRGDLAIVAIEGLRLSPRSPLYHLLRRLIPDDDHAASDGPHPPPASSPPPPPPPPPPRGPTTRSQTAGSSGDRRSDRGSRRTTDGLPSRLPVGVNDGLSSIDVDGPPRQRKLQKGINRQLDSPLSDAPISRKGGYI